MQWSSFVQFEEGGFAAARCLKGGENINKKKSCIKNLSNLLVSWKYVIFFFFFKPGFNIQSMLKFHKGFKSLLLCST